MFEDSVIISLCLQTHSLHTNCVY